MLALLIAVWLAAGTAADAKAASPGQEPPPRPAPGKPTPPASPAAAGPVTNGLAVMKWTGDLDGMIKRRRIRILTPYSRTHYFIDRGVQRGLVYDAGQKFETDLNTRLKTGNLRVHVVYIPTSRDGLLTGLNEGRGDIVAAALTITPERQEVVDFTVPTITGVNEIVVTGPGAPAIATTDDLAGKEVFVRRSSSYYESLMALNQRLKGQGKPEVVLKPAPETLEDEDLLEMVNAGLVKIVVVDNYIAEFWKQVLPALTLHPDVAVRTDGQIAMAVRKGSPKLKAALDAFVPEVARGTAFGNIAVQRYLKSTKFVKSATAEADMKRFQAMIELFRKYGSQYEMDWLLMAAQGYQESRLDQSVKSQVGAVGVMQVMPATGKDLKVGDISQLEPNIHAGVKYMRFMINQYYANEPMDRLNKGLFSFASYNAGPARIRALRREAQQRGLDPNVWFNNVERVASERIGRETVTYVSNIYKYYVAYTLAMEERQEKERARQQP
jgi:membrane-bound lytic murein transglycosylase MltF